MNTKTKKRIWLVVLLGVLLTGLIWQSVMVHIEKELYVPTGEYADLGTYQSHYYSQGEGDSVFCFITGSGTPCAYTDFYALQNMLASRGQTITFDHAGSGWSTAAQTPRTIDNLASELSELINTAAPNKQVVLLCHSLGSLEAIRYAQMNPKKVKGIIFLDSGTPQFYSTDSEFLAKIMNRSTAFIRVFGINRLLGELGILLPLYGENIRNSSLSKEIKSVDKAMYYQFAGNPSNLNSIRLINENAKKVLEGPSLGEIPVLILSSDSGKSWNDVQMQLLSWSKNSKQITLKNTTHYLYWSNYDQVTSYINEFVTDTLHYSK